MDGKIIGRGRMEAWKRIKDLGLENIKDWRILKRIGRGIGRGLEEDWKGGS